VAERIPVFVYSDDLISQAGVAHQLRGRPETWVVEDDGLDDAEVAVVVADQMDQDTVRVLRALQRSGGPRVLVLVGVADEAAVLAAVEAGAVGLLRRAEATPERLATAVKAARAGEGTLPPDLLGGLMHQVGSVQRRILSPRGLNANGFSNRELEVLRLLGDGHNTATIAGMLDASERTVKGIIHDVNTRYQFRNRSHAVAYAVRAGLI
jgi:DNA-binding NarL/FixJ family response regulator